MKFYIWIENGQPCFNELIVVEDGLYRRAILDAYPVLALENGRYPIQWLDSEIKSGLFMEVFFSENSGIEFVDKFIDEFVDEF